MTPLSVLDTLLLSAITALAGVIGVLWRALNKVRVDAEDDRRQASRLIFALLGARALQRGEKPPPTSSTPEEPKFKEAQALALETLNGDVEVMLQDYLASEPPPKLPREES